jgi:lipoprotein-releasing system permease protein
MYKLLLCWRYLRTRYLALVCIVSVMLGVATLIVVNSVMGGFSTKLRDRLHGLLSDVMIETQEQPGFALMSDPQQKMDFIRRDPFLNDRIEVMAGTMEVFAILSLPNNRTWARPVRLIGIDPEMRAKLGSFQEFLKNPKNRRDPSKVFEMDEDARMRFERNQMDDLAWMNEIEQGIVLQRPGMPSEEVPAFPPGLPIPKPEPIRAVPEAPPRVVREQPGVVIGYSIAHFRKPATETEPAEEVRMLHPGDDLVLSTVSGAKLKPVYDRFTITDYVKTEMSEYDSNYVFVPLSHLQKLRATENQVTTIQIKLKDYRDSEAVVKRLQEMVGPLGLQVSTWEHKQSALLSAIDIEKGILNVLLFLIIAVAGFGILAIFSMIVVEKTRDIGILKALGASNGGVMKIFLGYGLLLGIVGAGCGTILGLTISNNINEIENFISGTTGKQIFDRGVYYFDKIPVDIQPLSVLSVVAGAIAIAVLFSVLPALRAAMLHPVRALRFE